MNQYGVEKKRSLVDLRIFVYILLTSGGTAFMYYLFWPLTGIGPTDLQSYTSGAWFLFLVTAMLLVFSLVMGFQYILFSFLNAVLTAFIVFVFWPYTGSGPLNIEAFWTGWSQMGLINGMAFFFTLIWFRRREKLQQRTPVTDRLGSLR